MLHVSHVQHSTQITASHVISIHLHQFITMHNALLSVQLAHSTQSTQILVNSVTLNAEHAVLTMEWCALLAILSQRTLTWLETHALISAILDHMEILLHLSARNANNLVKAALILMFAQHALLILKTNTYTMESVWVIVHLVTISLLTAILVCHVTSIAKSACSLQILALHVSCHRCYHCMIMFVWIVVLQDSQLRTVWRECVRCVTLFVEHAKTNHLNALHVWIHLI
jgi:hypothetical protein